MARPRMAELSPITVGCGGSFSLLADCEPLPRNLPPRQHHRRCFPRPARPPHASPEVDPHCGGGSVGTTMTYVWSSSPASTHTVQRQATHRPHASGACRLLAPRCADAGDHAPLRALTSAGRWGSPAPSEGLLAPPLLAAPRCRRGDTLRRLQLRRRWWVAEGDRNHGDGEHSSQERGCELRFHELTLLSVFNASFTSSTIDRYGKAPPPRLYVPPVSPGLDARGAGGRLQKGGSPSTHGATLPERAGRLEPGS
jgi:hypothetical protein